MYGIQRFSWTERKYGGHLGLKSLHILEVVSDCDPIGTSQWNIPLGIGVISDFA